jgi:hypothetical protein
MDEIPAGQINYRNFALPLCLLSVVFFMLYILVVPWVLIMTLHRPMDFGLVSLLIGGLVLLVSCTGTILFVREVKAQSFPWTAGIPLYSLFGVIIVFTVFFVSQFFLFGPVQVYLGLIALGGFMSLPWGVAYLLRSFKGIEFKEIQSFSSKIGLFGFCIAVILFFSFWLMSWMSSIGTLLAWAALFGIFHILVLMPLTGAKLFQLGISFSKNPSPGIEAGKAAEPVPRKKITEIIHDIQKAMSPRAKRAILIALALVVVIAAWYVYLDITDTTPCRKWTQISDPTPFLAKTGFSTIEYRGNIWVIGGTPYRGGDGEAWYSGDGITWDKVSSPSMVPQRVSASPAVFRDGLWVIAGGSPGTMEPHNDIWYSGDGRTWYEMQHAAEFSPRSGQSAVVFDNRLWVIGGLSQRTRERYNDVWYSDDGITWRQATAAAGFSPRAGHASFVYRDMLWVIGGWDSTEGRTDVWNSDDGIAWTKVAVPETFERGSAVTVAVFDGRIWVFQNPDSWGGTGTSPQGIWYSYDGVTWTKVNTSPEFFRWEYGSGELPVPFVFQNRLYVLQAHEEKKSGIWYTMPSA